MTLVKSLNDSKCFFKHATCPVMQPAEVRVLTCG